MTAEADIVRNRRRAFALPGGFHDKLIRLLGVALPVGVGVIAAVMILSPLTPRGEVSVLLDRNKVAVVPDRLRAQNATYRGDDDQGRPFSISAGSAVQHSPRDPKVELERLRAQMLLKDGPAVITAPSGDYLYDEARIAVQGPVTFSAADGYRMLTSSVDLDLRSRHVTGSGGVSGSVPAGTFSADAISADLGDRTVTLTGNAHLHMVPGKLRMPE